MHRSLSFCALLLLALALPAGAATITLAWDYLPAEEAAITGYRIEHSLDNQATWQQAATALPVARTASYALTATGRVCWRALAVTSTAASAPSNVVCHVFPAAPTLLSVTVTLSGIAQ